MEFRGVSHHFGKLISVAFREKKIHNDPRFGLAAIWTFRGPFSFANCEKVCLNIKLKFLHNRNKTHKVLCTKNLIVITTYLGVINKNVAKTHFFSYFPYLQDSCTCFGSICSQITSILYNASMLIININYINY